MPQAFTCLTDTIKKFLSEKQDFTLVKAHRLWATGNQYKSQSWTLNRIPRAAVMDTVHTTHKKKTTLKLHQQVCYILILSGIIMMCVHLKNIYGPTYVDRTGLCHSLSSREH